MARAVRSGGLEQVTLELFRACDRDGSGALVWNNGEVRNFITAVLARYGLKPPPERQVYQLYCAFDKDSDAHLDERECLRLVELIVCAAFSLGPRAAPAEVAKAAAARESREGASIEIEVPMMRLQEGPPTTAVYWPAVSSTAAPGAEAPAVPVTWGKPPLVETRPGDRHGAVAVEEWLSSYRVPPMGQGSVVDYVGGRQVDIGSLARILRPLAKANSHSRARMVQAVEDGSLMRAALQHFRVADRNATGTLTWNDGEIRDFVKAVLVSYGLRLPTDLQIYEIYSTFDADNTASLDARECLCLVDGLVRAIFHNEVAAAEEDAAQLRWLQRYVQLTEADVRRTLQLAVACWRLSVAAAKMERAQLDARLLREKVSRTEALLLEQRERWAEEHRQGGRRDNSLGIADGLAHRVLRMRIFGRVAAMVCAWRLHMQSRKIRRSHAYAAVALAGRQGAQGHLRLVAAAWHDAAAAGHRVRMRRARTHAAVDLVLQKWERGASAGVLAAYLAEWRRQKDVGLQGRSHQRDRNQTDGAVALMLRQWERGGQLGLLSAVFSLWARLGEVGARGAKPVGAALDVVLRRCERSAAVASVASLMSEWRRLATSSALQRAHARAQGTVDLMMQNWGCTGEAGLVAATLHEWRRVRDVSVRQRLQARAREGVALALQKWERGDAHGLLGAVLALWKRARDARLHGELLAQRDAARNGMATQGSKMRDLALQPLLHAALARWHALLLAGHLEARHGEARQLRDGLAEVSALLEEERRQGAIDRARLLQGETRHAEERRQWAVERSQIARGARDAACHTAVRGVVERWIHGQRLGLLACAVSGWQQQAALRRHHISGAAAAVELWLRQRQLGAAAGLLSEVVAEWAGAARERRRRSSRAKARQRVDLLVRQWEQGALCGLLSTVLVEWRRAKDSSVHQSLRDHAHHHAELIIRRRQRARAAGLAASALQHWAHWLGRRAHVQAAVRLVAQKWARGDAAGVAAAAASEWRLLALRARHARARERAHRTAQLMVEQCSAAGLAAAVLGEWRRISEVKLQHLARERTREGVALAAQKWELGCALALLSAVLLHWRRAQDAVAHERLRMRHRETACAGLALHCTKFAAIDGWRTAHLALAFWHASVAHGRVDRMRADGQHVQDRMAQVEYLFLQERQRWAAEAAQLARRDPSRGPLELLVQKGCANRIMHLAVMAWRSWRHLCEHRQRKRQGSSKAMDFLERQRLWAPGSGTVARVLASWQHVRVQAAQRRRRRAKARGAVELVIRQWEQGIGRGLLMQALVAWSRLQEARAAERGRLQGKQRTCAALERAAALWLRGGASRLLSAVLGAWRHAQSTSSRQRSSVHAALGLALRQWERGAAAGLAASALAEWGRLARTAAHARATAGLQRTAELLVARRSAELLAGAAARGWRQAVLAGAQQRARARAHECVASMVRRWERGDEAGLLADALDQWRSARDALRREQEVESARADMVALERMYAGEVVKRDKRLLRLDREARSLQAVVDAQQREQEAAETHLALSTSFSHWRRFIAEVRAEVLVVRLREAEAEIGQLQEIRRLMEEKLQLSYAQLDQVTSTMLKEVRSKENLTAGLRLVYKGAQDDLLAGGSPLSPQAASPFPARVPPPPGRSAGSSPRRQHSARGAAAAEHRENGTAEPSVEEEDPMGRLIERLSAVSRAVSRRHPGAGAGAAARWSPDGPPADLGGAAPWALGPPLPSTTAPELRASPRTDGLSAPLALAFGSPTEWAGAARGGDAAQFWDEAPDVRGRRGSRSGGLPSDAGGEAGPAGCTWDQALPRMREEGILREDSAAF